MRFTTTRSKILRKTSGLWSGCSVDFGSRSDGCRNEHKSLNYLARFGSTEILKHLFGEVLAPEDVLLELRHPNTPVDVRAWAKSPPSWLRVVEATRLDLTLPAALGMGERAAISLALREGADLLLIDDRAGRREAELRHIAAEGTLALLLKAALQNQLDLPDSLARLCRYGFRASSAVIEELLDEQTKAIKNS